MRHCGSQLKPGDSVYAMLDRDHGGYAEYVIVKERDLAAKPRHLDYTEATAVPLAAITAWQGLFDHGDLRSGQRVLIHGGAGGVGHFAIQFAKARGAVVATTVSHDDLEFVRELGADRPIDYRSERFEDAVRDVNLVFDLVNGETQERSWAVLQRSEIALVSALPATRSKRPRPRCTCRTLHGAAKCRGTAANHRADRCGQGDSARAGNLPFSDVQQAQQQLEHGHVQGKIVLELESDRVR